MASRFLSLFFLMTAFSLFAQDRIPIKGKITVAEGENLQGMTVFNETSKRGTITDNQGEFTISAAENDSLSFSALQFQEFTVVIDKGVIDTGELNVYIREAVTELPEVIVLPHDLSGNVNVDVARIRVSEADLPTYSAADLERMGVRVEPDSLTGPGRNEALAAGNTRLIHGLNFVNIFKFLAGVEDDDELTEREIDEQVREMYDNEFFQENLNIKRENINDFIFYARENGLTGQMMQEGNELDLIQFLIRKSEEYKQIAEEN